jgi:hypothetical protein
VEITQSLGITLAVLAVMFAVKDVCNVLAEIRDELRELNRLHRLKR